MSKIPFRALEKNEKGDFMSSRIIIGTEERNLCQIDESWIAQQIVRRKQAGAPVCVMVKIDVGGLNFTLTSGDCPVGGNSQWTPSPQQQHVIDLWNMHELGQSDINPGELIAFLKQVCKH
jgi:hypothetical protein